MAVPPDADDGPDADPSESLSLRGSPMCDAFPTGKIPPLVSTPPPSRAPAAPIAPPGDEDALARGGGCLRCGRFWRGGGRSEYRRLRAAEAPKQHRPRWYLCVLGSVRFPATTDMSEIRRRQSAAAEGGGGVPRGDPRRGTWRLLRSLSCTGVGTAAAVMSPLEMAAHVQSA